MLKVKIGIVINYFLIFFLIVLMYSKWYKCGFSRASRIRRTFQFKEELRPRTSISFFFRQSDLIPGNRAYVSPFSLRSLPSYHSRSTYVLSRIWDTCDVLRRFRHSATGTLYASPNTCSRSSNLNNRIIDFRALVRAFNGIGLWPFMVISLWRVNCVTILHVLLLKFIW